MPLRDGLAEAGLVVAFTLLRAAGQLGSWCYQRALAGVPAGLVERAKVLDEWHCDPERQAQCDEVDAGG